MKPAAIVAGVVIIAVLAVIPFIANTYVTALLLGIFLSVGLTYAWNLLSGYTGYLSFGQVTFFGLGAYIGGMMIVYWHIPWLAAAFLAGIVSIPFSAVLGWIMLRLRGPFFAIGMLGCAQITQRIISMIPATHGGAGLYLPPIQSIVGVYYAIGGIALFMIALTSVVHSSAFGLRLRSIKDAEDAAEVLGVDTTRCKVYAFMIASFVPTVLGGIDVWYLSYINPPSAFANSIDLQTVAMGVLGGLGTVWGPLVGAVTLSIFNEVFWAQFPQIHLGLLGLVIALAVLFLRRGLVPVVTEALRRRRLRAAQAKVAA